MLIRFAATILLFGSISDLAWATADGPDTFAVRGVAPNDVLFVREKPNAASAKRGSIPHNGRGLRNLGCVGVVKGREVIASDVAAPGASRWCRVEYNGVTGWVNARFLREDVSAGLSRTASETAPMSSPPLEGLHGPAAKAIQSQIRKARLRDAEVTVFYGDLTGQGTKDAISFVYSPVEGGNSTRLTTWIWREREGAYALVRTVNIDELFGAGPRNVKFSPGSISVTTTILKPDDPRCCPTGVRTFTIPVRK